MVIGNGGGSGGGGVDPEPILDHADVVKRIFSSYYHNRNTPGSTKFKYPFVVRNPPSTEHKLKTYKNEKIQAAASPTSSSILRNLMENMTDDEIINEVFNLIISLLEANHS